MRMNSYLLTFRGRDRNNFRFKFYSRNGLSASLVKDHSENILVYQFLHAAVWMSINWLGVNEHIHTKSVKNSHKDR